MTSFLKVEVNTNCILLLPNTWKERQMFSMNDTTSTCVRSSLPLFCSIFLKSSIWLTR